MDRKLLRIVYAAEFLLALIAVFTAWSQIGGQGHLDLMAWYLKLPLGLIMAYAIVRATSAAADDEHGWNIKTVRWMGILVLAAIVAGVATYYAHLYEPTDDEQDEPTATSSLYNTYPACGRLQLSRDCKGAVRLQTTSLCPLL